MRRAWGRRAVGAGRRLLAWGAILLLLAASVWPLLPTGDSPALVHAEDSSGDYSLDAFVPEQPVAVEAQGDALAKRIAAGDALGALVPAAQATPVPQARFAAAHRPPDDRPPPLAAMSHRLTTGPPRPRA